MSETSIYDKYEAVIGLEIHAQMQTKSKAFSSDSAEYGALPNHHVSTVSLGHPGTLPRHNKQAVANAVKMGLACNSHIRELNYYARKNYFYADLPKGYQITQDKTPICNGGFIKIKLADGSTKNITLTRIHMEEDSGKSMHDQDPFNTLVDFNRAGVALIEIVTEPEIRSSEEAYQFVTEIRKLVRYLDICDGNMEEGSLRVDANVSVRLKGAAEFGTKVEVKNMNSISNVRRAIEFEVKRQIEAIEAGETLLQETRSFDAVRGLTFMMRSKELAVDYRYFPEPDLPPLVITQDYIEDLREEMPELPEELFKKFTGQFGLPDYDAQVLTESKELAAYYEAVLNHTKNYKAAANWVMGGVKSYLNENAVDLAEFPLAPEKIAEVIALIDEGKVSNSAASQSIFPELVNHPQEKALTIAERLNLIQESDEGFLEELIDQALAAYPDKVEAYRAGNKNLLGLFMGEVMKASKGKADPKATNQLLIKKLNG